MKTLITHINPHLDDICAIWLFKKFHNYFKDAEIKFLSAAKEGVTYEGKKVDSDPEVVHFGIGRGKFDEHKGDTLESASSLVWQYIKESGMSPKDEIEFKALEELVYWNTLIDTGKAPNYEFSEFSVQSFIRPLDGDEESSKKAIELGEEILDRILEVLKRRQQSIKDWEGRQEFQTRYGLTIAVSSETVDRAFCKTKQGDLFLMYDPKFKSIQFYSDSKDLMNLYEKLKKEDPEASWFLHHSHHMVICGSSSAPDSKPTKLSLNQLIEVVKFV